MVLWVIIAGVAGVVVSIALLLWIGFVIFRTQQIKFRERNKKQVINKKKLKTRYLECLDAIELQFSEGNASAADVFFEVSRALRNYASERDDANYSTYTLREIIQSEGLANLGDTVKMLYAAEFFDREKDPNPPSPTDSIEWGRDLIRRW